MSKSQERRIAVQGISKLEQIKASEAYRGSGGYLDTDLLVWVVAEVERLRAMSTKSASGAVGDMLGECRTDLLIRKSLSNEQADWLVCEVERLKAELAAAQKQVSDAVAELPSVAGPLAHRLRMMRKQYDGWCKEYRAERDIANAEVAAARKRIEEARVEIIRCVDCGRRTVSVNSFRLGEHSCSGRWVSEYEVGLGTDWLEGKDG